MITAPAMLRLLATLRPATKTRHFKLPRSKTRRMYRELKTHLGERREHGGNEVEKRALSAA